MEKVREPPETTGGSLVEGSNNYNKRTLEPLTSTEKNNQSTYKKTCRNKDIEELRMCGQWRRLAIEELPTDRYEPNARWNQNKTTAAIEDKKKIKPKSDQQFINTWKEVDVQGIKFIGRRMAKQDVITFSAQLVDEIKKKELTENPEEKNGTWKTVQEMTRNGTYTGQLSAIVNEKYEKHTMAMKD